MRIVYHRADASKRTRVWADAAFSSPAPTLSVESSTMPRGRLESPGLNVFAPLASSMVLRASPPCAPRLPSPKSGAKRSLCTRRVLEGPPACPLTGIVACQQARQKVATMHARKRHRPAGCHRLRRVQDHTLDVSAGSVQDRRDLPAPALPGPPADVRCLGPQGPKEESGLLFVAEERQRPTSEAGERQRLDASSPRPADHPPPVYRRSALGPVLFPSNSPIPGPVSSHPCSSRHV
jgi:hypothetical protein